MSMCKTWISHTKTNNFQSFPLRFIDICCKTESHWNLNSFKYKWIIQWYSCNEHIPTCLVASNDMLKFYSHFTTNQVLSVLWGFSKTFLAHSFKCFAAT